MEEVKGRGKGRRGMK